MTMRRRTRAILLAVLALALWPAVGRGAEPKHILLLSANDSLLPAYELFSDGFQATLLPGRSDEVEVFTEFLDAVRFADAAHAPRLARFIRDKYAGIRIDLIIALGPQALAFATEHRAEWFPHAPLLTALVSEESVRTVGIPADAVALVSRFDVVSTLELALRLQPEARRVAVVSGAAPFDRRWDTIARRQLQPYARRLEIRHLSGLPLDALLSELGRLPRDSIILVLTYFQDGAGRRFRVGEVTGRISAAAGAPVYGLYDTQMGRGIVGGYIDSFEAAGTAAARIALRLLAGEDPKGIRPVDALVHGFIVDWRQLERWKLDASRLPPGTAVRFREPSLWERYRAQIVTVVGLLLLQFGLIVALLLQGRRRRRVESSLGESEERMALAALSANLGFWHWDVPTDRIWATEQCRRMFGREAEVELTIGAFFASVHLDDRASALRGIHGTAASGQTHELELRVIGPDGSIRWLGLKGQARKDAVGRPARVMGIVVDVTERRRTETESEAQRQQLAHLTRVAILGELTGALAHEMNQPLSAILSNAQAAGRLLAATPIELGEIRSILDDIVSDDRRAADVINRIRGLLKKDGARYQVVDLGEIVVEILELAHSVLIERNVTVTARLTPGLPRVRGDRVQLQQVVLNLVMNGCEAMSDRRPTERVLTISTAFDGNGSVEVAFGDRGRGIPPEMAQRLFEPFVTTKTNGLGLGLTICRTLILAHGGRLWAVNNSDGGATVAFALPIAGAETGGAPPAAVSVAVAER